MLLPKFFAEGSMPLLWFVLTFSDGLPLRAGLLELDPQQNQLLSKSEPAGVGVVVFASARPGLTQELSRHALILGCLSDRAFLVHWHGPVPPLTDLQWAGQLPARLKAMPNQGQLPAATEWDLLFTPRCEVSSLVADHSLTLRAVVRQPGFTLLRVAPPSQSQHQALAEDARLFWMEPRRAKRLLNDRSVWVCQTGMAGQTTPVHDAGIRGEGQIIGFLDTGVDADHCSFFDPAQGLPTATPNLSQRKIVAYFDLGAEGNWDSQGHGTHVGGSLAGDNSPHGLHNGVDGMAPAARLVVQDGGYAVDDYADMPFLPADYINDLFLPSYQAGARIHSNSWGAHENFGTNNYTVECQMCDQFMWDHPDFLIFFAAGNSGHSGSPTVSDPATAKNVVAVGATNGGTGAESMASFSSNGPVQDGRLKPDLLAPGAGINSSRNDSNISSFNCNQQSMSGTSMACPTAAGLAALVRQYYADGFYPTGSAQPGDAFTPSAALVKATLLASSRGIASRATWPDNVQGYGRITLDRALFFSSDDEQLWVLDHAGLQTGQSYSHALTVGAHQELRAFLVWTDYPSTPVAANNLVNNLDLSLSGPGGSFLGNVWNNGVSTTGGSADTVNNVEALRLQEPALGSYTLTVQGSAVPQGPQPFALVVVLSPVPETVLLLNQTNLTAGAGSGLAFQVDVPSGALTLTVRSWGGSGDADLYLRHGVAPTTSTYDASSAGSSNDESVTVASPAPGTWHILLHAWSAFSGVSLEASYQIPYGACATLGDLLPGWPASNTLLPMVEAINCL